MYILLTIYTDIIIAHIFNLLHLIKLTYLNSF